MRDPNILPATDLWTGPSGNTRFQVATRANIL